MRVRRPSHVFVRFADIPHISIDDLVRGEVTTSDRPEALASTPIRDGEQPVSGAELRVLSEVPSGSWMPTEEAELASDADRGVIDGLVEKGLLLSDEDAVGVSEARERDRVYGATFWNPHAAYCHFNTKWRGRVGSLEAQSEEILGLPEPCPDPYFDHDAPLRREPLPQVQEERELHRVLRARRTTRAWELDRPLPLSELSAVLTHAYGSLGEAHGSLYPALKKTSPSGGAMHPVEVFPLVRDVEGLSPGLYHYNVRARALDLISEIELGELDDLAARFLAGQRHFLGAAVMCVMVVRFYRHNWKYRGHFKAYKVVLMDAAHLSQTFYLVCAERGLGAFFTGAINESDIEEALGLDPLRYGVVGINGCGYPAASDPLALRFAGIS